MAGMTGTLYWEAVMGRENDMQDNEATERGEKGANRLSQSHTRKPMHTEKQQQQQQEVQQTRTHAALETKTCTEGIKEAETADRQLNPSKL